MSENKSQVVKKPTHLEQSEYARTIYRITPGPSIKKEDLIDPDYWAHVALGLRPGDHVEAVPEDRHYYAELFVLASAKNWAKVKLMRYVELIEDNDDSVEEGFDVKWAGRAKWRVLRGQDVLSEGHDTKPQAMGWLAEHKKDIR